MRNAMLISSMLTNSSVWYGMKEKHYVELEQVDEYFLKKLLNTKSTVAKEMLYLETSTIPIRFLIKQRRLNYLHHLLTRNTQELISKVYFAQCRQPGKNDWVETVKNDRQEINLGLSDQLISAMSKNNFKDVVKKKISQSAFNYLVAIQ